MAASWQLCEIGSARILTPRRPTNTRSGSRSWLVTESLTGQGNDSYKTHPNTNHLTTGSTPTPPSALLSTAFHEAGHAVMALARGRVVQKVTIRPGKSQFGQSRLGLCELGKRHARRSNDLLEDEVLILFAGMVAESRLTGQYCHEGAAQDLRMIQRLLQNRAGSVKQLERLQRRLLDKTEHLLDDQAHANAIELIADRLVQDETVSGRAVRHYYKQALQQGS